MYSEAHPISVSLWKPGKQPCINELAILEEMLSQQSLLHETAFFQNTGRRRVACEDVSDELRQTEFVESVLTQPPNNGGHDALAPERFRKPVPDFSPVGLADLQVIQAAATDQAVVSCANGKMSGLPLLLGCLGDTSEKSLGVSFGIWEGNAKSEIVDVLIVEQCDNGALVRWAKLGQVKLVIHDDFQGRTYFFRRLKVRS